MSSSFVTTPPMVGPTWPRVRSTLGSDCLPALSQGIASFRLAYGLTAFVVTARIRCLVIGVVLVRCLLTCLCGPEGYTMKMVNHSFNMYNCSLKFFVGYTACSGAQ